MAAAPRSPSRVRFPVIREVTVSGYQLYPGPEGTGFSATVHPGVNIVVGINGLGKTTLLTALFRALSGPADWAKRSLEGPAGSTSSALGNWRTPDYFINRVPDGARKATISVTIAFGRDTLQVTRRLNDLKLTEFRVGRRLMAADEEFYRMEVRRLSRLPSFEDFYSLLRYTVFYLEDRQTVIWDESAQSEILRILFFEREGAATTRELHAQIQTADSQIRNYQYALTQHRKRLIKLESEASASTSLRAEAEALATQINASRDSADEAEHQLAEIERKYETERREFEDARFRLHAKQSEYEEQEQRYFALAYPDLGTVATYVYSHATSGGGCLVCGDRSADVRARIARMIDRGLCPVCESEPSTQEGVVPPRELADLRLETLDAEVNTLRQVVTTLDTQVQALVSQRTLTRERLAIARAKEREAGERYRLITGKLPKNEKALSDARQFLVEGQRELAARRAARERLEAEYRPAQEAGEERVREIADAIIRQFALYSAYFLADRCTLRYEADTRRIGEEGSTFRFPRFHVELTSGVFEHTARQRDEPHEVSESQKEFIDLAFRMALITVASGMEPAMMVLETPEATLDAVFITRAGRLLGHFAAGEGKENRLIASCNLNQTHMISALFGVVTEKERRYLKDLPEILVPEHDRLKRVINLLEVAVENAALAEYRELYDDSLDVVLYPEHYVLKPEDPQK